ncbi:MAG: glycosyltransferase family 4 protein [Campylobacterales bacterium]
MIHIYYYHPLSLTFSSAQTLQVVKDYFYLSKEDNYKIFLYGFYSNHKSYQEILEFLQGSSVVLSSKKESKINRTISKIQFLKKIIFDKNPSKVIITRSHQKSYEALRYRSMFGSVRIIQEFHEESFPYLLGKKIQKKSLLSIYKSLDGVIFTNFSQLKLYEKEFDSIPQKYTILPNGVELERFSLASMKKNYVLTYLGQFNDWKNVPLLFQTLSLLDQKYTLRIAGGKGDVKSKEYIDKLALKYNVSSRVEYLGFVKNSEIVEKVLNNSNILLLPLGDNIQSKYLTSPMKLFEYMATKIPVLAVNYPSVTSIATDNEVFLSKNNPESFAEKIVEIDKYDKIQNKITLMNKKTKMYSYENRSKQFSNFLSN